MRIGLVTGEYPPMEGGVGAFTRELARALAALGHPVHVFTRAEAQGAAEPGVEVSAVVRGVWSWGTIPTIRRWAAAQRLDVVNVQFQTAAYNMHPAVHWLPARLSEARSVITFHDLRVPYLFPKAGPAREWTVRRLARTADGVVTTNRADEVRLRDEWGVTPLALIPIGSNVRTDPPPGYRRDDWRARHGVAPGDLLISYFGFLNESKGGLVLVEALARLAERGVPARLVMMGGRAGASDPTNLAYGERLDALVAQRGLTERVIWTGFVDDADITGHFLASDVTALPYLDGVSLRRGTLMAALAHGRAIVTTEPEVHEPELEGVVETVPAGDAGALTGAIERVWRDDARRTELERAALDASAAFRWETIAERTVAFFEGLHLG